MQSDLGLLKINNVILHDVPRHLKHAKKEENEGPILSEVESPMTGNTSLYFQSKVITSIQSPKALDITFDAESGSPVPALIKDYLANPKKSAFIKNSQAIAIHLYNIQGGQNPHGLLALVDCSVAKKTALAIVKLEREEGIRLKQTTVDNKKTFNFDFINDLIFTEKTKVYKVSLFIALDKELKHIEASASDNQAGYFKQDLAKYFLSGFLGCMLLKAPTISTKKFYELSEQFFNEEVDDPIKRTKYYNHLTSALTSQSDSLSPEKFAKSYLDTPDRQPYIDYLHSQGLTEMSFPLDTKLIDGKLKHQLIEFEQGVSIVISSEGAQDRVKWTALPDGEVKAEIKGVLKTIKGRG
jgi:37-kD nucleoid-associated bacterial protein